MLGTVLRRLKGTPDADDLVAGAAAAAAARVEAATGTPADPRAAAFFDVDNTMMRGASIFHFARGLAARDFFSTRDLTTFAWRQVKFRIGGSENHEDMMEAREAALAFVAGKPVDELRRHAEDIYDELMAERIWSGTHELARQHMAAGRRVWLITATPVELANIIADRLELTGALGTVSQIQDGRYTGHLSGVPLHGTAKAEAIRALAAQEHLDLQECFAYSDSINDRPMLELVGHPVVINPDTALRQHARREGWPILDFRTGRKAIRLGLPGAAALIGAAVGIITVRRRRRRQRSIVDIPWPPAVVAAIRT
ncbi:MAG TPA: HAD-IB family hydrolase [Mycobacteriales bacterium]|nr:HAD-IB family hydrolase [Mycobacteriales bacterium]